MLKETPHKMEPTRSNIAAGLTAAVAHCSRTSCALLPVVMLRPPPH